MGLRVEDQGWIREINVNDALPGLKITQSGAGDALDVQGGDISLGAGKLKTTDLALKQEDSSTFSLRNAADSAYRQLRVSKIGVGRAPSGSYDLAVGTNCTLVAAALSSIDFTTDGYIAARNADAGYTAIKARDTGVGLVEIARLVGAADPAFEVSDRITGRDTGGASVAGWSIVTVKVTRAHDSALFDAAALVDEEGIWTQPANSILLNAKMVLDTQFVATSMTDLDVTLGVGGDHDSLLAATMNLTSDATTTEYKTKGVAFDATAGTLLKETSTVWRAYSTAVGANLDTTTAGQVSFYFTYIQL